MSARTALVGLALAAAAGTATAGEPPDHAEGAEWAVRVGAPGGEGPGRAVALHLASRAGYHVNLEYPMAFRPAPEATLTFRAARVPLSPAARTPCPGRPQETCAVVLALPFTPPEKGEARLAGTLAFSVCSPERCLIQQVALGARLPVPAHRSSAP